MRRFKNILYFHEPGTESSSLLQNIVNLARVNKASLTLCDVAEDMPDTLASLDKTVRTIRLETLYELLTGIDTDGVELQVELLHGIPFIEVVRKVIRDRHDLLIKHAEEGIFGSRFGSDDLHLMRKCPCPVWIAKSEQLERYRSIIAAVDVARQNPVNEELNTLILDLATSLVLTPETQLHIVHAWSVPHEYLLRDRRMQIGSGKLDELIESERQQRAHQLTALLGKRNLENIEYKVHMAKEQPAHLIQSVATAAKADLVIMGTVARTGIAGFFIGNTAERVLNSIDCSVLAVKPGAFVSPVQ